MRWTERSRSWVKCPCGLGIVVTIREADENNHIRNRSVLNCSRCRIRASENWNEDFLRRQRAEKELHEIYGHIMSIFQDKYHHYWMEHFGLCKSKRAVWEILRESGIYGKSLSAFYEELRAKPLPCYLEALPEPYNIHLILDLLEIEDNKLLELLNQKKRLKLE